MRDAGCKMRDAGCRMQDAGCKMRDAGCGMQDAGCMKIASELGNELQLYSNRMFGFGFRLVAQEIGRAHV